MPSPRLLSHVATLLACALLPLGAQSPAFTVSTSPWDSESLGNHRAVVTVAAAGRFAHVSVP